MARNKIPLRIWNTVPASTWKHHFTIHKSHTGELQIMHKTKIAHFQNLVVKYEVEIGVVFSLKNIVIPPDKMHGQQWHIMPPFLEQLVLYVGPAMKQVAYKNELPRFEILDLLEKSLQVFFINRRRHGYTCLSEMARLTKVKVRHDQDLLIFPIQTALSREPELGILKQVWCGWMQKANLPN